MRAGGVGNVSEEGADYQLAVQQLGRYQARASELRQRLADAQTVPQRSDSHVGRGSQVVLRWVDGEEQRYRLVSSAEADPTQGRLSIGSPPGQALLGHQAGERVRWVAPAGARQEVAPVAVGRGRKGSGRGASANAPHQGC